MIQIATACGAGMGSSLVLRMYTEDVVKQMGIDAKVQALDASQAKSAKVDLILTSPSLVKTVSGGKGEVKAISNYSDKGLIKKALIEYCQEKGIAYKE